MARLDLLLRRFDDRAVAPALHGARGARPFQPARLPDLLWDEGGDPQDLRRQRWAVIAPLGAEGDRLLALIKPLIDKREADQGAPVSVLRVPPQMSTADAARWSRRIFDRGGAIDALPRYQLLLGDLDQVPLAVQQVQQADGFVGRLAFETEAGYLAYVDKLLRSERTPSGAQRGPALIHTVHDQTAATQVGFNHLARPCLDLLRGQMTDGRFEGDALLDDGGAAPDLDALLTAAAWDRPGVLFTISHGMGAPTDGWSAEARMRRFQGALSVGQELLDGAAVQSRAFVPGGLWFTLACYGAGTPAQSAYQPWLEDLARLGDGDQVALALSGLPPPGARPFIAAAPKAALANPDGPLGVIGHIDLAWSYSFSDTDGRALDRPGRFAHVIRAALRGDRLGTAHRNLARFAAQASTELTSLHEMSARGEPVDPIRTALVWMLRQDVADYILLGDPAARLPFTRAAAQPAPSMPATINPSANHSIDSALEEAIGGVLAGDLSVRRAARQSGLDRDAFEAALATYRDAGRAALLAARNTQPSDS